MKWTRNRLILLAMAVVSVVALWRTVSVEQQRRQLVRLYDQAQRLVAQLQSEKDFLNTELTTATHTIEDQTADTSNLRAELASLQSRLDDTSQQLASLQHEHDQLKDENRSLFSQVGQVMLEKQQLEARLTNLRELKLAMRDVRHTLWQQRVAAWKARGEALRQSDEERLASGNRGYLIRNGQPTLAAATRLQVHVLDPQSQ